MRIAVVLCLCLVLAGCAISPTAAPTPEQGLSIRGSVHGGQQPIAGAHVYLFAANTTGYGQPSVSLLNPSATGAATDSVGTYVTTDALGAFTITGDYTCTTGTQVYLYALGGNPGAGVNSAAGLLAILGQCPSSGSFASALPFVTVNEVSTIAAAYAMAGFADDATHVSSSGTPLALTGIANAFANATNLASISTGAALTTTPAGNGTVPQAKINTLANILAACINSTSSSSATCSTLFSNTLSGGSTGATPTDTATAAINIAHNPMFNVPALFALPTATAPFVPTLSAQPADFMLALYFNAMPVPAGLKPPLADFVAIDASGNVWLTDQFRYHGLVKLSPLGVILSPGYVRTDTGDTIGYSDPTVYSTAGMAIDNSGNVWVADIYSLDEFSNSGQLLASTTAPNGTLSGPNYIVIDPTGNLWVPNSISGAGSGGSLVKFSYNGTYLSAFTGGGLNSSTYIGTYWPNTAVDASGNIWAGNIKVNNQGAPDPASPFNTAPNSYPEAIAVDSVGNLWTLSNDGILTAINSSGTALPGSPYNSGVGIVALDLAIDGKGNPWAYVQNQNYSMPFALLPFNSSGVPRTGGSGISVAGSAGRGFAIDGSGNIWLSGTTVTEVVGVASPVVTPISAAVKNNTIASRP